MKSKLLAMTLLLSLLFISTTASSEGISLSTSIGTHSFESLDTDILQSKGSFIIQNQEPVQISVYLSTITDLKAVDLNITTKEPRTHSINQSVFMHEAPQDWITFEQTPISINPSSSKRINYTLTIPTQDLPSYIGKQDGFLSYIHIHMESQAQQNATASVSDDYDFKVFTIFNAELPTKTPYTPFIYILLASLIVSIILIYINDKYNIIKKIKERRLKQ